MELVDFWWVKIGKRCQNCAPKIFVRSQLLRGLLTSIYELQQILIQILIDQDIEINSSLCLKKLNPLYHNLKKAEKPKKSKIEWISERTRSKLTNIWPFWKSCCGFPVWATLKVDIDSEHSVHKVFLIFYGSTTLLYSERTLNGWEQGPFMPKDFVKGGSIL